MNNSELLISTIHSLAEILNNCTDGYKEGNKVYSVVKTWVGEDDNDTKVIGTFKEYNKADKCMYDELSKVKEEYNEYHANEDIRVNTCHAHKVEIYSIEVQDWTEIEIFETTIE